MEWLKDNDKWDTDNTEAIGDLVGEIESMRNDMENDPDVIADIDGERAQDYGQDLGNLEDSLESLRNEKHDVYDLRQDESSHYGLPIFEYNDEEYSIGDDIMANEAAWDQVDNLLDDIGFNGFSAGMMEWYVDGEMVADDFESMFYDDVSDSPEDYLDVDDDRELTDTAVEQLEAMSEQIGEYQVELEDTDISDEIDREYLVDQIEALEEAKVDLMDDEDSYEWTEYAKEEYVKRRLDEVRNDPVEFLQDYGYGTETYERYIDRDKFIEGVIDADGRANGLSSYDGEEGEVSYGGDWYYIYRLN